MRRPGRARSTIYAREAAAIRDEGGVVIALPKRGPRIDLWDDELTELIRAVINSSPFAGEGHRKVTARLTGSTASTSAASGSCD